MALNDMTSQLSLYNMNILPSVSFFIAFFRQVLVEERTLTLTIQGDIGFGVVRNCVFQKYCGVELELKVEVTPTCSKLSQVGERKMHLLRLFRSTSEDAALSQIPR